MRTGFSEFDRELYSQELPFQQRIACLGVLALGVGPILTHLPPLLAALLGLFAISFALLNLLRPLGKWIRRVMAIAIVAFAGIAASNDPHADMLMALSFAALAAFGAHNSTVKAGLTSLMLAVAGIGIVGSDRASSLESVIALFTLWGVLSQSYRLTHLGQPEADRWWPALALAIRTTAWGIPVALMAALILPHVSLSFLHLYHSPLTGGGNGNMMPGEIDDLLPNPETAFRATFLSRAPEDKDLYWRASVLWGFDGSRWSRPEWAGKPVRTDDMGWLAFDEKPAWRYTTHIDKPNLLVALDGTLPGSGDPDVRWSRDRVMLDPPLATNKIWKATHVIDHADRLDEDARAAAMHLPMGLNPKTHAMVGRWMREDARPEAIILRTLKMFNGFQYTMRPGRLRTANRIDEFLTSKKGYCEHFSSAFAVVMREAGIPARVVVGYHGGKQSTWGGWWRILESDAHAWNEVWLNGRGWVRIDPTAVVPGFGEQPAAWRRALSNDFFDWISVKASQSFKSVQQMTQGTLLSRIDWDRWSVALIPLLLLISMLLAWRLHQQSQRHQQRFHRAMGHLSRKMARRDPTWERAPHEGVRGWAERVAGQLPEKQAEEIKVLAEWWSQYQFSGRQSFPESLWRSRVRLFRLPPREKRKPPGGGG